MIKVGLRNCGRCPYKSISVCCIKPLRRFILSIRIGVQEVSFRDKVEDGVQIIFYQKSNIEICLYNLRVNAFGIGSQKRKGLWSSRMTQSLIYCVTEKAARGDDDGAATESAGGQPKTHRLPYPNLFVLFCFSHKILCRAETCNENNGQRARAPGSDGSMSPRSGSCVSPAGADTLPPLVRRPEACAGAGARPAPWRRVALVQAAARRAAGDPCDGARRPEAVPGHVRVHAQACRGGARRRPDGRLRRAP